MLINSSIHCPTFKERVDDILNDQKLDQFRRLHATSEIVTKAVRDFSTERQSRRNWYWTTRMRVLDVALIRLLLYKKSILESWWRLVKILKSLVILQRKVKIYVLRPSGILVSTLARTTKVGKP